MSAPAELRRIDAVAPGWFAASLIGVSVVVAALLLSGWRPSQLPVQAGIGWWFGAAAVGLGLACIGYAGCPIYWGNVPIARRQKSVAIRAGLVLLLGGSFIAFVVMISS